MRFKVSTSIILSLFVVACSGSNTSTGSAKEEQNSNDSNDSNDPGSTDSPGKTPSGTPPATPPGTPPPPEQDTDAGSDHDSGTTTSSGNDLGQACKADSDCKSNVCFVGGSQSYCSLKCTSGNAASVCAPPTFDGVCNKQGFCRLP
jgi:hypothetical protein